MCLTILFLRAAQRCIRMYQRISTPKLFLASYLKILTHRAGKVHNYQKQMFEDQKAHSEICIKNTCRIFLGKNSYGSHLGPS